jgi:hypothetical protein
MYPSRESLHLLSHSVLIRSRLNEPTPLPSPVVLSDGSTLKLTFTTVDMTSGDGVFPHQAHLLFEDPKGGDDVTLPVTVKSNGRASYTLVSRNRLNRDW